MGSGAWLGAAALGRAAGEGDLRTISIFHTTDLHGHIVPTQTYEGVKNLGGFARCVTCIRQWRKESPDSLLVDVGDVYQGTAESLNNGGKLMIGLFNELGYDAWTLGNHDFDWGPEMLETNLKLSKMPVLTGNLVRNGKLPGEIDGAWAKVRPWMMKEVGGFKIALVGLVTPGLPYWLPATTLGGVAATDPAASLRKSVAEAKSQGADAVVLMGHMGWRASDDFANPVRSTLKDVPGVDVFLAAHTHQDKPSWMTGSTLCTQANYYGIHCGRVDLTFDVHSRKVVDRKATTVLMDQRFPLDPVVMNIARPDLEKAWDQLNAKVATAKNAIPGQGRDSAVARLFCEIFSAALGKAGSPVDGVFHGTFGTGDIPKGDVTVRDCWKMLPYENVLATAGLSGAELLEVVQEDWKARKSDRTLWPFELKTGADGQPEGLVLHGKPVEPAQRLTIAFNSYDMQSGGRLLMRLREITEKPTANSRTTALDTRAALIAGLLEMKELG